MTFNYINIESIVGVKKFDFSIKNELAFIKNSKAFILDDKLNEIQIDSHNRTESLFFFKSDLYVTDGEPLITKIYTNLFQKTITLKHGFALPPERKSKRAFENYLYPGLYVKDINTLHSATFDTKNYKITDIYESKMGINGIYQIISSNSFLSQNNEKFGVFRLDNTRIWERHFTDLDNEHEPIGWGLVNILNVENKLYVELDKTYCIDINTGDIEHAYDQGFTNSENEFLYRLRGLSMKEFQLQILNTKTNKVEFIDVSDEFNKHNVYPDDNIVVSGGLIYFSQNMGDVIAKIGVLNPESGKILWKYDFGRKNGMIGTLRINGNRVYAHTQDKTLHIFEKEFT